MLERYVQQFRALQDHSKTPRWRKRCMLLAVIELAERGALHVNEIHYGDPLLRTYRRYYRAVEERDDDRPWDPFFNLQHERRHERFWRLTPRRGREEELAEMHRPTSETRLRRNVDHAVVDGELHRLLQQPGARSRLRVALCSRWSREATARALQVAKEAVARRRDEPYGPGVDRQLIDRVAEGSFRDEVLAAYDYRCAASGWRILLPGTAPAPPAAPLIEVVRLLPPQEAGREDVRFGMALAPTWSRALRAGLIAPAPDMRWRVSPIFEQRIADHAPLRELAGRQVIFTGDPRHRPARRALEWSLARLLPTAGTSRA